MSGQFFRPFWASLPGQPDALVYPRWGDRAYEDMLEDAFSTPSEAALTEYLTGLYREHQDVLADGRHHLVFMSRNGHQIFTEIWVFVFPLWARALTLRNVYTFRGRSFFNDAGLGSFEAVVVAGAECELYRRDSLKYRSADRSNLMLPVDFVSDTHFGC